MSIIAMIKKWLRKKDMKSIITKDYDGYPIGEC